MKFESCPWRKPEFDVRALLSRLRGLSSRERVRILRARADAERGIFTMRGEQVMNQIDRFQGVHRFLSNFYPCIIVLDGETYNSVEHAYQAAKTDNQEHRRLIRLCAKPGEAKRLGRRVALRPDWDRDRIDVMRDLLRQKFSEPSLHRSLLATGTADLIEGNEWNDRFWGVCRGSGENWLGKLLMEVRTEAHLDA